MGKKLLHRSAKARRRGCSETAVPASSRSRERQRPLRIGAVPYMNGKPLVCGISRLVPGARLTTAVPSRLTAMLARRELDVALIPVMGYFTVDRLEMAPGIGIISRGPVESVRLFYRGRIGELRRVRLDSSSMTSAALVKIILKDRYHLNPGFVTAPPPRELRGENGDAVLLIGDKAMQVRSRGWRSLDLGSEWHALTGRPFVYAVWAGLKGGLSPGLGRALNAMKALGLSRLTAIARAESRHLGLPFARCRTYLSKRISYDLGPDEAAGMAEFLRRAIAHGLVKKGTTIRWARG